MAVFQIANVVAAGTGRSMAADSASADKSEENIDKAKQKLLIDSAEKRS